MTILAPPNLHQLPRNQSMGGGDGGGVGRQGGLTI